MVVFDKIKNYYKYKRIYNKFKVIKESRTKHTIQINFGKKKVVLSKKGNGNSQNLLNLISKVKRDAILHLQGIKFDTIKNKEIYWYKFNTDFAHLDSPIEVAKIDLSAAYWSKAINIGILSNDTVDYFESYQYENLKEKKDTRLKALGSLGTVKKISEYNYGKKKQMCLEDSIIFNYENRELYMYICYLVSEDMMNVLNIVGGYYYYWDCLFVNLEKIEQVKTIFSNLGYNFTVEKEIASINVSKNLSFFECSKTNGSIVKYITYPIN